MDQRLLLVGALALLLVLIAMWSGIGRTSDDRRTVAFVADGERVATIDAAVADTPVERYRGLGGTDDLGADEGMLFVFRMERSRTFVMRGVPYPIDIVFVGSDRTITAIHTAEPESRPYTKYRGRAKWVIEVPAGFADRHGIAVGDRIRMDG